MSKLGVQGGDGGQTSTEQHSKQTLASGCPGAGEIPGSRELRGPTRQGSKPPTCHQLKQSNFHLFYILSYKISFEERKGCEDKDDEEEEASPGLGL